MILLCGIVATSRAPTGVALGDPDERPELILAVNQSGAIELGQVLDSCIRPIPPTLRAVEMGWDTQPADLRKAVEVRLGQILQVPHCLEQVGILFIFHIVRCMVVQGQIQLCIPLLSKVVPVVHPVVKGLFGWQQLALHSDVWVRVDPRVAENCFSRHELDRTLNHLSRCLRRWRVLVACSG